MAVGDATDMLVMPLDTTTGETSSSFFEDLFRFKGLARPAKPFEETFRADDDDDDPNSL